jgi:hypothetical protein
MQRDNLPQFKDQKRVKLSDLRFISRGKDEVRPKSKPQIEKSFNPDWLKSWREKL